MGEFKSIGDTPESGIVEALDPDCACLGVCADDLHDNGSIRAQDLRARLHVLRQLLVAAHALISCRHAAQNPNTSVGTTCVAWSASGQAKTCHITEIRHGQGAFPTAPGIHEVNGAVDGQGPPETTT